MKKLIYIACVTLFPFLTLFAQTSSSWPHYRGNNILNGVSQSELKTPLRLLWTYKTGDEIKSSPVIAENKIFVGTMDGYVIALNMAGKLVWRFKTIASVEAPPIIIKKTLVVGCMAGTVYALDIDTGKLKWKFKTDGQIAGSANWFTDRNGIQLLVPSYDYSLYCLNLETGKMNWKNETNNYLNGAAATDNRKITIGGCDSYMHIIDAVNGKGVAKIEIGTYVAESSAISGNLAFVGDYDGGFTCVDLNSNKVKWKFNNPRPIPFLSSPAVSAERVVIGSHDRKLYCFDKNNGKILWTYQTYGKIDSSPLILNDRVIICSNDGMIHFVSLNSGKKIYEYEIGVAMKSSPAVIDNLLVIGGKDGLIYTFRGAP